MIGAMLERISGSNRSHARRTIAVSAIAIAAALAGIGWIMMRPSSETTDDAYVAADSTTVAPKVRGLVAEATPQQALAAGRLVELEETHRAEARAAWPKAWKKLRKTL